MKKISRSLAFILAFAAVNLVWRLIFLPVNQSSYTDGILQVNMFHWGLSFWPPFYALLTRLVAWLPGLGLEGAGRAISLLSGVLVLFPLAAIARRMFGGRAAIWAMAAWTVCPMALRWSLQVMTDMPMVALWMASLATLTLAVECYRPNLFSQPQMTPPPPEPRTGNQWLLIASLCGALATLTRYQGVFLLAPLMFAAGWAWTINRKLPNRAWNPWLSLAPWLAAPAWMLQGIGSIARHGAQIGARTSTAGPWATLLNYWLLFEDFILYSPYFLTFGVFGFMLYGLFRTRWATARLRWLGWVCLLMTLAVFVLQAVFQSFQERYLLPLVPLACLFAGHGLATWERHGEGHPVRFWGLAGPALAGGLAFSALVAVFQGNPFMDLKQASLFVRGLHLPATRAIYSNEFFNAEIGPEKTRFWTGDDAVRLFGEMNAPPRAPGDVIPLYWTDINGVRLFGDLNAPIPAPGDVIILFSYACGVQKYKAIREQLKTQLGAHELKRFARFAWPLLPDIMQEPGTSQNPVALDLRYQRQYFETTVLQLDEATPSPGNVAIAPGGAPPVDLSKGETLRKLSQEIQTMKQELKGR